MEYYNQFKPACRHGHIDAENELGFRNACYDGHIDTVKLKNIQSMFMLMMK